MEPPRTGECTNPSKSTLYGRIREAPDSGANESVRCHSYGGMLIDPLRSDPPRRDGQDRANLARRAEYPPIQKTTSSSPPWVSRGFGSGNGLPLLVA